ncbi:MAG: glycerol kinase [Pseudohongiellaceae bacterium]|jgi:glycerol kinase
MTQYILSIDQGTTSSRAVLFDAKGEHKATSQCEFKQYYPNDGWVEHDPEDIWSTTLDVCQKVIAQEPDCLKKIVGLGITNQRETTIVWDRSTGVPIYRAIVWQDRRTAGFCQQLKERGVEKVISEKTGLLVDPYFSASKIRWILENVEEAREKAERGELAFGTVDSFLLWRLTGGLSHATDATNASRTSLFNIHTQEWDDELLEMFEIPRSMLPEVKDCSAEFGLTEQHLFGLPLPVLGMIGDQQSALVGQACFTPGMVKSTYGTGCFMIANTGDQPLVSKNRLLTTIAYRLNGKACYALEGSIFVAGAAVQWLRDGVKLIKHASETSELAKEVGYNNKVYLVPAFTGLGAPYWDPNARGALFGLTRDTGIAEIVTAGLQSVCYQTRDLLVAMEKDGAAVKALRVDGGMVINDWVMQFLSDILNVRVDRPKVVETTALGAAFMVGLQAGIYSSAEEISSLWQLEHRFLPEISENEGQTLYDGWLDAVKRVISG